MTGFKRSSAGNSSVIAGVSGRTKRSNTSPADLRAVFDRAHEQVLREVRGLDEGELDQPVPHPPPFAPTKLRALLWCARHEMLHAGQIGLLRRQLGYAPLR